MTSGSKRQRLKAFIRKSLTSSTSTEAVSNDIHHDAPTTCLTTGSSNIVGNQSLHATNELTEVVNPTSSPQDPGDHEGSGGSVLIYASPLPLDKPIDDSATSTIANTHDTGDQQAKLLFKHTTQGAAHDPPACDPQSSQCHPGTRTEISKHVITWFCDKEKKRLLIWVYGPAGAGKSATMLNLVDKLAKSKRLGASVFISESSERNDSRRLFFTIAHQLALHIEDYRTFITEKLGQNPQLINQGMLAQFQTFIVEPFVEKKIGAGCKPWGIILDGLNELDPQRSQREIIHLIADFVIRHPDSPLLWAIVSRPEMHICDTFDEDKVAPAYVKEYVSPTLAMQSCLSAEQALMVSQL